MYKSLLMDYLHGVLELYFGFLSANDIETAKAYLRLINNLNGQILDEIEDK